MRDQQLANGGATSHKRADAIRKPEVGGTPRLGANIHVKEAEAKQAGENTKRREKKAKIVVVVMIVMVVVGLIVCVWS